MSLSGKQKQTNTEDGQRRRKKKAMKKIQVQEGTEGAGRLEI